MVGQWIKTESGRDVFIVDYQNVLVPPSYNKEQEKKISDAIKKYREMFGNFAKENNIELIANGKKF